MKLAVPLADSLRRRRRQRLVQVRAEQPEPQGTRLDLRLVRGSLVALSCEN